MPAVCNTTFQNFLLINGAVLKKFADSFLLISGKLAGNHQNSCQWNKSMEPVAQIPDWNRIYSRFNPIIQAPSANRSILICDWNNRIIGCLHGNNVETWLSGPGVLFNFRKKNHYNSYWPAMKNDRNQLDVGCRNRDSRNQGSSNCKKLSLDYDCSKHVTSIGFHLALFGMLIDILSL